MQKILIANRGEIARRVIRACHDLGLQAVAIHSGADDTAAHVEEADDAVPIGPARARASYLDTARILAAAASSGADAVHPGYGFLSENADFAEAVIAAGLTWIGPRPDILRAMGDKQRAREIARAAGVPVVPGSERIQPGAEVDAHAIAEDVGYPLLVKAAAGGGGIGMRRVDARDRLRPTIEATQSMAARAFGDGTVFLERFVPRARHVEVQVFGFGDGSVVHLFERDCSLQRRFQKVIEEGPAPGLPEGVAAAMADAACALCRATAYEGAGTVEFMVDTSSGEFFFLEMNTRIQVEHPVTEMITGADLVAMQIDFARGRLTTMRQDAITRHGHAIECRLYAENPARQFRPSPGQLACYRLPASGADLRIESGYREGETVTPHYDPMLAKLIAWGPDRPGACDRAVRALAETRVEGVATNRDFLVSCLESSGFRDGEVHTAFIDENAGHLGAGKPEGQAS